MSKNRLLIQTAEDALRIEFRLEFLVCNTVVNVPEFVFREEGCRIERLTATKQIHDAFDTVIEMPCGIV